MDYTNDELTFMNLTVEKFNNFLIEFDIEPSIRCINSFAYACQKSITDARNYLINRVKIVGGNFESLKEKVKSKEFQDLFVRFKMFRLSGKKINNRLKVFFGPAGTGKTTLALKEAKNKCIICNSSMLPCDLLEEFTLADGKGNLTKSSLRSAMENGETIVLDELGCLSLECLRFLQGITDSKSSFDYKGDIINIKDGFKIIGTMNLYVNGSIYPLNDALVDRVEYDGLIEFSLPTKKLVEYAFI